MLDCICINMFGILLNIIRKDAVPTGYLWHTDGNQFHFKLNTFIFNTPFLIFDKAHAWMEISACIPLLLTECHGIFTSPRQVTSNLQKSTAPARCSQYGDRLDFHCILYQAKCVVNPII